MDLFELFRMVKSLSILLLVIFSIFLFTSGKEKKLSSIYLGSFLLARAIMQISFTSWDYFLVWKLPDLALLANPFLYMYCPLLYLYTKAQTNPSYSFKKIELLHFVPAAFIFTWNFFYFNIHSFETKIEMIKTGAAFYPVISWNIWMWTQLFIYGPLCIYLLHQYRSTLKRFKSSINQKRVSWLTFLIYAFLAWKVIFLTYYFAKYITGSNHQILIIIVEIFFLLYAIGIIYFSLRLPEIHFKQYERPKYKTSPLTNEAKQELRNRIDKHMKQEKPFLDPDFDLSQLSIATAIPMHHLSQMFSEVFSLKFYDYCNKYRIEEMLELMSIPQNYNKTILELMYIAGFNSKSVFNTAFKKYIGMTPKEYKRNLILKMNEVNMN